MVDLVCVRANRVAMRITVDDGGSVVSLAGALDLATKDCCYDAVVTTVGSHVRVDLTGLTFVDCSGYGALTAARDVLEHRGDTLTWGGAIGQTARFFHLVGAADTR